MRTAAFIAMLLVALMASPAIACRSPNPIRTLFDAPPAPLPYEGVLLHGRFTNQGHEFEAVKASSPTMQTILEGEPAPPFAVLLRPGHEPLRLYAEIISSCGELWGRGRLFDQEAWVVGKLIVPADPASGVYLLGLQVRSGDWTKTL